MRRPSMYASAALQKALAKIVIVILEYRKSILAGMEMVVTLLVGWRINN